MKKRMIIIAVITLVVSLLVWRLWPCSFTGAMSVDRDSVSGFHTDAMVRHFENGESITERYQIDLPDPENGSLEEIFQILGQSGYQQDFRNLLPWGIDSVGSDSNYDGRTLILTFVLGNEKDAGVDIHFLSSSLVCVSGSNFSGYRIYHPTNPELLDNLIAYLQAHATEKTYV